MLITINYISLIYETNMYIECLSLACSNFTCSRKFPSFELFQPFFAHVPGCTSQKANASLFVAYKKLLIAYVNESLTDAVLSSEVA